MYLPLNFPLRLSVQDWRSAKVLEIELAPKNRKFPLFEISNLSRAFPLLETLKIFGSFDKCPTLHDLKNIFKAGNFRNLKNITTSIREIRRQLSIFNSRLADMCAIVL